MQYGFVIDHARCIGCHACTVACKAENDVPVGSFRTSVKYVELGLFPEVRRHFLVQRCNHCSDAPCVTICPVNALEKRSDGIVDLDRDACIGCRACMQACPYDALYLNEDRGAVEKCHFCSHRVEKGLEPACVNVCPVNAIIAGDLNDGASRTASLVASHETSVRAPEQRTGPNVHYIGAAPIAMEPGTAARPPTYMFSDRPPGKPEPWPDSVPTVPDARVVLDAGHRVEWGWPIALYLVTKGIAAGAAVLAPLTALLGMRGTLADWAPAVIGVIFVAATSGLLVEDLAHPSLFYRLVTRPNWKSWLVKGGVLLGLLGASLGGVLIARGLGLPAVAEVLEWISLPLGLGAAGYTAFLFAQCRGRDLWESRLLLPHLIVQALLCGSAVLLPLAASNGWLRLILAVSAAGHLLLAWVERARSHETRNARQAAAFLGSVRVGPLRAWRDGLLIGVVLPLLLLAVLPAAAFVPVLAGLVLYEHAFVRAGQLPPLS